MNPEHEILVDLLRGHTYKMSPLQYMEVQSHLDPEFFYVIDSKVTECLEKDNTYRPWNLFKFLVSAVASIISERESFTMRLDKERTHDILLRAYDKAGDQGSILKNAHFYALYAVNDAIIQIRYHRK